MWTWKDTLGAVWIAVAGAVLVWAGYASAGCSAAQPACAVVDIADHACDVLVVRMRDPDGTVREVRVPREELERTALELDRAVRDAGVP